MGNQLCDGERPHENQIPQHIKYASAREEQQEKQQEKRSDKSVKGSTDNNLNGNPKMITQEPPQDPPKNPMHFISDDALNVNQEPNASIYSESHNRSFYKEQSEIEPVLIPPLPPPVQQRLEEDQYLMAPLKKVECITIRRGTDIYSGQLTEEGTLEGLGKLYREDGALYVGQFRDDKAEGEGKLILKNGNIYQGHFYNNQPNGHGRYQGKGFFYEGQFKNGLFNGTGQEKGEYHDFKGDQYSGNRSQGVLKWEDHHGKIFTYKGKFNFNNEFHGQGVLREEGGTYQGEFKNGEKDGKGVYTFENGLRYDGEYKKGLKDGKGILYNYDNSIAYEGQFKQGLPHGKGAVYGAGKKKYQTIWEHGVDTTQKV